MLSKIEALIEECNKEIGSQQSFESLTRKAHWESKKKAFEVVKKLLQENSTSTNKDMFQFLSELECLLL